MENDIFIAQPRLPPNDSALVTNSVVSCSAGLKFSKLNELHSSTRDVDRVFTRFFRVTTIEAALNESSSTSETKSGLAIGNETSGTFLRAKRNSNGPNSPNIGGERAFASSSHCSSDANEEKIAESQPIPLYTPRSQSIDSNVTQSKWRSIEKLNERRSSKNEGERAAASSPHTSLFNKKEKTTDSQHPLPNHNPTTSGHKSAIAAGAMCLIVILYERYSSKSDGELAPASTLSKELSFYRVSLFPLSECQLGCHYKSWLLQARNHVRWK